MNELTLILSIGKVNLLLAALQELPFKLSSKLIEEIIKQSNEQLNKKEDAPTSK